MFLLLRKELHEQLQQTLEQYLVVKDSKYPNFRLKSRICLVRIRIVQCLSAMGENLSLIVTIIFGMAAFMSKENLIFFLLPTPVFPLLANYQLSLLSGEAYAKKVLANQKTGHAIMFTSWMIRRACFNTVMHTYKLHKLYVELEKTISDMLNAQNQSNHTLKLRKDAVFISEKIKIMTTKAERYRDKRNLDLERIYHLKKNIATKICLPFRRVCDHIFQYSSFADERRFSEFLLNSWNIREYFCNLLISSEEMKIDKKSTELLHILLKRNIWIHKNGLLRIVIQDEMINYYELHDITCSMATSPSSSEALRKYAKSLGLIGNELKEKKASPADRLKFLHKAKFLHRKQRTYPGMDLNYMCSEIYKLAVPVNENPSLVEFLDNDLNSLKYQDLAHDLKRLPEVVNNYLYKIGGEISENFIKHIEEEVAIRDGEHAEKEIIFITQGYSETVRNCLEKVLNMKNARVFVLRPEDQISSLKSQLLFNDLKEFVKTLKRSGEFGKIEICDNTLLPEILPKKSKTYVVSGAEIFDSEYNIVNCAQVQLIDMVKSLSANRIEMDCIVVVGEFKKSKQLLYSNVIFTRDHLESMGTFTKYCSLVVTEKGCVRR